jgi:ATP/maltotriose-dependent transcriptional regulator MalT
VSKPEPAASSSDFGHSKVGGASPVRCRGEDLGRLGQSAFGDADPRPAPFHEVEQATLVEDLGLPHAASHIVNQVYALTEAGRLLEAETLAKHGWEKAIAERVPIDKLWFAANLGRVAILQGRASTARRYYAEAEGVAHSHRFVGPRRIALSGLALAHALMDQPDVAAEALEARNTLPAFGFLAPQDQFADAWMAIARRQPAKARELFEAAAAGAAATGHLGTEAWLLHDLMRTGGVDVSGRLGQLADQSDSALVSARARHARAARGRDPRELAATAGDFEAMGAMLLAAEAASAAADAYRRAGDPRAAARQFRRSRALAVCCEAAIMPGVVHDNTLVPLSGRERQVVMLAAEGFASNDIATRLKLSVRTVTNHLQNAYTKLGVGGRAELAEALERTHDP